MCLAIPALVVERVENNMAKVDIMGVTRTVSLDLTPEAVNGNFVLVHAGFALQVIDQATAEDTLELLKQIPFFAEEEGLDAEPIENFFPEELLPKEA
jgi:hydrogenase expression/formation protein HypC